MTNLFSDETRQARDFDGAPHGERLAIGIAYTPDNEPVVELEATNVAGVTIRVYLSAAQAAGAARVLEEQGAEAETQRIALETAAEAAPVVEAAVDQARELWRQRRSRDLRASYDGTRSETEAAACNAENPWGNQACRRGPGHGAQHPHLNDAGEAW